MSFARAPRFVEITDECPSPGKYDPKLPDTGCGPVTFCKAPREQPVVSSDIPPVGSYNPVLLESKGKGIVPYAASCRSASSKISITAFGLDVYPSTLPLLLIDLRDRDESWNCNRWKILTKRAMLRACTKFSKRRSLSASSIYATPSEVLFDADEPHESFKCPLLPDQKSVVAKLDFDSSFPQSVDVAKESCLPQSVSRDYNSIKRLSNVKPSSTKACIGVTAEASHRNSKLSEVTASDSITYSGFAAVDFFFTLDGVAAQVCRLCTMQTSELREDPDKIAMAKDTALTAMNGLKKMMASFEEATVEETATGEFVQERSNERSEQTQACASAAVDRTPTGSQYSTTRLGERLSSVTKEYRCVQEDLSTMRRQEREKKRRLEELRCEAQSCISEFDKQMNCVQEAFMEQMKQLKLVHCTDMHQLEGAALHERQQLLANLSAKDAALASAEATIRELGTERNVLAANSKTLQQQIDEFKTRLENTQAALDAAIASEKQLLVERTVAEEASESKMAERALELEHLKEVLDANKVAQAQCEDRFKDAQNEKQQMTVELSAQAKELQMLTARHEALLAENAALLSDKRTFQSQLVDYAKQNESFREDLNEAKDLANRLQQEKATSGERQKKIDELLAEMDQLSRQLSNAQTEHSTVIHQLDAAIDARKQLEASIVAKETELSAEKERLLTASDLLSKEIEDKAKQGQSLHVAIQAKERELAKSREENGKLTMEVAEAENALKEAQAKLIGVEAMCVALQDVVDSRTEHELILQRSIESEQATNAQLSADLVHLTERLHEESRANEEAIAQRQRDYANLHADLLLAQDQLLAMQYENDRLVKIRNDIEAEWKDTCAKLDEALQFKQKYEAAHDKLRSIGGEILEATKQVQLLSVANDTLKSEMTRESQAAQKRVHQLASLQVSFDVISGNFQDAKKEIRRLTSKVKELNSMIEPFRAQLEAFAAEKTAILGERAESDSALQELANKYADLLGHQNNKQKIKHIMDLKNKLANLQQEVVKLRATTTRDVRRIQDLEVQKRKLEVALAKQEKTGKENQPATNATVGQQKQHKLGNNNINH